jgi:hypothetical protein
MRNSESDQIQSIPFYAIPVGRAHENLVPIYRSAHDLSLTPEQPNTAPLCYASPAVTPSAAATVPLKDKNGKVIAYAWPNPQRLLIFDFSIAMAPAR